MKMSKILFCLLLFLNVSAFANTNENQLAVHLLSYLAQDYSEAVRNGKIISKEEYQEQVDFSKEVLRIAKENNYSKSRNLSKNSQKQHSKNQ